MSNSTYNTGLDTVMQAFDEALKTGSWANGSDLNDPWNNLSTQEKAMMMRVANKHGILNLSDIKKAYNKYAEGGPEITGSLSVPKTVVEGISSVASGLDTAAKFVRRRLYDNITPFGYHDPIHRTFNSVVRNLKDDTRRKEDDRINNLDPQASALDAIWATYLNIPENQRRNIDSKYGISKTKDGYYRFNSPEIIFNFEQDLSPHGLFGLPERKAVMMNGILGNYTTGLGRDNKGDYIFYSDSRLNPDGTPNVKTGWDINPYSNSVDNSTNETTEEHGQYGQNKRDLSYRLGHSLLGNVEDVSLGIGTPVPIYDKMYLDDVYAVPNEYRGSYFLPNIEVKGSKKKAFGGPLVDVAMKHIYDGTTEPTQQMNGDAYTYFGKSETTGTSLLPDIEVIADRITPKKYVARYNEEGNPVYTTDPTLSMGYDPEASKRAWERKARVAEVVNRPAGSFSDWMKPLTTAVVGGVGGAMLTPFAIAPVVADMMAAPVSTIGGFVGGEIGDYADRRLGVTDKVNEWAGLELPEGTLGNLTGGVAGGWLGSEVRKLPQYLRLNKTYTGVPHRPLVDKATNTPILDSSGNAVYMDDAFLKNKNNIPIWSSDSPEYAKYGTWNWDEKSGPATVFDVYTDQKELSILDTPDVGEGKLVNWQLLPYKMEKGTVSMADHLAEKASGIPKDRFTSSTKRLPNNGYNSSDFGTYVFKDGEENIINAGRYGAGVSTDDVVKYSKDLGKQGTRFYRVNDGSSDINGEWYDFPINELVLNPGAPSYALPHGIPKYKVWNQLPKKESYNTSWILPLITSFNHE